MKNRYWLFRRNGVFYLQDAQTLRKESLHLRDASEARRLRDARNAGAERPPSKIWAVNIRRRILWSCEPRPSSWPRRACATTRLPTGFRCPDKLSASGASASSRNAWTVWKIFPVPGVRPFFPPELVLQVKALACELPHQHGLPLSRYSGRDLVREVARRGLVASISGRTLWRWLDEDAIRPWQHRSWIFPRDPDCQVNYGGAAVLLDPPRAAGILAFRNCARHCPRLLESNDGDSMILAVAGCASMTCILTGSVADRMKNVCED